MTQLNRHRPGALRLGKVMISAEGNWMVRFDSSSKF